MALTEQLVLRSYFGGPFVVANRQLGPVEELEHALVSAFSLGVRRERGGGFGGEGRGTERPLLCCFAFTLHGKEGLPYEWRMLL